MSKYSENTLEESKRLRGTLLVTIFFVFMVFKTLQSILPNSVCIGFGPVMKTDSSRRFKWYSTHNQYASFKLVLYCGWLTLVYPNPQQREADLKLTYLSCGILFELSWWAHFHCRAKTYAYWVWHSSKIGELCFLLYFEFGSMIFSCKKADNNDGNEAKMIKNPMKHAVAV